MHLSIRDPYKIVVHKHTIVVNTKALFIMRYQDDINTEHNMKSIGRAAVAQWTKRLTRNGQTERRTF